MKVPYPSLLPKMANHQNGHPHENGQPVFNHSPTAVMNKPAAAANVNTKDPESIRKYLDHTDQVYLNFFDREPRRPQERLIFSLKIQEVEICRQKILRRCESIRSLSREIQKGREMQGVYQQETKRLKRELEAYKDWMKGMVDGFVELYDRLF